MRDNVSRKKNKIAETLEFRILMFYIPLLMLVLNRKSNQWCLFLYFIKGKRKVNTNKRLAYEFKFAFVLVSIINAIMF